MMPTRRKPYTISRDKAAGWWDVDGPDGLAWGRYIDRRSAIRLARLLNNAVKLERVSARARGKEKRRG